MTDKIPAAPVIPPAPSVKGSAPKAAAKPSAVQKVEPKVAPPVVATAPKDEGSSAAEEEQEAPVQDVAPVPPTLVRFRADFEYSMPFQRVKFSRNQVVSSQHFDLHTLLKQGAQLDVVEKNERGEYETLMDLGEV